MRKIIERTVCLISCLLILWAVVSWAEVVSKNLKPSPTYAKWNMWVLVTEVSANED